MIRFAIPLVAVSAIALPSLPAALSATGETRIDPGRLMISASLPDARIYCDAGDAPLAADATFAKIAQSWHAVGGLHDIVLDARGRMKGVVADLGDTLGRDSRRVLLPVDNVRVVPVGADDRRYALIVHLTEEELDALPEAPQPRAA